MKIKTFLLSAILGLTLISCGPIKNDSSNNPSNSDDNTNNPITSEGHTEEGSVDPNLPIPYNIEVTQNTNTFIFGQTIKYDEAFKVEMTFNDKTTKVMKYDSRKINGWHFIALSDQFGQAIDKLPEPFNALGQYKVRIGATYNAKTVRFNKIFTLDVKGGSYSDIKPDELTVRNKRTTYMINDAFSTNDLVVIGNWFNNGGEEIVEPGDGNNGFKVEGINFDITKPLQEAKIYVGKVLYRGINKEFDINVKRFEPSEINYDYNNVNADSFYNTDIMPTKGHSKALIVPIWFNDSNKFITSQAMKDQIKSDIKVAYLGTEDETGWNSVRTYYEKDSYNQLFIDGVVADWFNVNYNGYEVNRDVTEAIVEAVSENYRETVSPEEWRKFDSDSNGYLDAVICIYAYPNHLHLQAMEEDGATNDNLWAYCFWLQKEETQNVEVPAPNAFFWASYDFMYQGLEDGNPLIVDAHTYIHEMGHILGLNDYYDYNGQAKPAGGFSMQDHNVGGHDPYSKLAYGWLKPYVPTSSMSITLHSFDETGEVILLSPEFTGSAFDEYILLEYYTPTGLNALDVAIPYMGYGPQGPDGYGLRVWHVDSRLENMYDRGNENYYYDPILTTRKNEDSLGVHVAMTNTTEIPGGNNIYCAEQEQNRIFHQLALLNQYTSNDRTPYGFNFTFSNRHLWTEGDTFSMDEYAYSFPRVGMLNSGKKLGFEFEILSQNDDVIVVNITKSN